MDRTYWKKFFISIQSLWTGLKYTFRHFRKAHIRKSPLFIADKNYFSSSEGLVTIQYPHEFLPVPEVGRYRLHLEIDDCIVCDKCAKICPVDCIAIEPIMSPVAYGKTSDGTPKRIHAAQFDLDMGKCCFCGLCTTVCPTECLTMTKVFDFSVCNIQEHVYSFADMNQEMIEKKKKEWDIHQMEKSKKAGNVQENQISEKPVRPMLSFKPKIKPPGTQPQT